MSINLYRWSETDNATKHYIMRRSQANIDTAVDAVQPIIQRVKDTQDDALFHYAKEFDNAQLTTIQATQDEFAAAEQSLDPQVKRAIQHCARNVTRFHEEQMRRAQQDAHWMIEIEPGVHAGEQTTAIDSVGLYVPRGKGAFPSALYMLAIPAKIAGVPHIAIATPPRPDGTADDASLYTARLCGVDTVYKMGGAQAIAAFAYGTQTVRPVKKILGPGNPYVAAAKRTLSHVIDPGMPAGPSESIVLCDETANPEITAYDLLNEAEHGKDSAALLITHDQSLAEKIAKILPTIIATLPQPHQDICAHVMQDYGAIIITDSLQDSLDLTNAYAPEHLHIKTKNAAQDAQSIKHAGEILIGDHTPCTLGSYGIGINHVLPTGGNAHTYSCTNVWDFLKRSSISHVTQEGLNALKSDVLTLTDYENFPAHGEVLRKR